MICRSSRVPYGRAPFQARPLFWWASYAWSRAEDELSGTTVRRGWDQEHALNIDIDARIARKFQFAGGASLSIFFEISNALNRRNSCCTEYELDDESEEPVLVTESIRSLPLLPSFGVIWRF